MSCKAAALWCNKRADNPSILPLSVARNKAFGVSSSALDHCLAPFTNTWHSLALLMTNGMKRISTKPWLAVWAVFLITPGGAPMADQKDVPAEPATFEQRQGLGEDCTSIAAARTQLAAVLKQLEEKTFTDIGSLRTELEQIQQQTLAHDQALAKAELRLSACSETEAELRQRIATLLAQRDELTRTVARLQAAAANTTQETASEIAALPDTPSPTPPAPDHKEATRSVVMTAQHWAEAWSAQDVDGYLAFYDEAFQPPAGMSRQAWAAQRRSRLGAPGQIRVEIVNPEVQINDAEAATISFTQRYSSERYSDVTQKRLVLKNRNGTWRIIEEQARPAK